MKLFIVILNIFTINCWSLPPTNELFNENWIQFKYVHNKSYNSLDEELGRLNIFKNNLKKIEEHNKLYNNGLVTYKMGLNQFADLTSDEFLTKIIGLINKTNNNLSSENGNIFKIPSRTPLRKSIDWRLEGLVTEVKNQQNCGSCWSFSTTGSIEGQYARKTGKLISLSEQNLIDCSTDYGNFGCFGGTMDNAYNYVKDHGIESEDNYPYTSNYFSYCKSYIFLSVTSISGYVNIQSENEEDLQQAIDKIGPISVAVQVTKSMQFYSEGVYYNPYCNSKKLNHAVLAVGYGTTDNDGSEYYIVKNSWGSSWGEQGYIRMSRNRDNNCGIATDASYPLI